MSLDNTTDYIYPTLSPEVIEMQLYQAMLFTIGDSIVSFTYYCISPIAIIGNTVILLAYSSKQLRKFSMSFYFCANAVIDSLFMAIEFSLALQINVYPFSLTAPLVVFYQITKHALPIISGIISMMASLDRLRFIVYPNRWKFIENKTFQWAFLVITFVSWISIWFPYGFSSTYYPSNELNQAYYLLILIIYLMFCFTTIACSIALVVSIKRASGKPTLNFNTTQNTKTKLVTTILIINLLFITCYLTNAIIIAITTVISQWFLDIFSTTYGIFFLIEKIAEAVLAINFSLPVFVHYFTNKIFMKILKKFVKKPFTFSHSV